MVINPKKYVFCIFHTCQLLPADQTAYIIYVVKVGYKMAKSLTSCKSLQVKIPGKNPKLDKNSAIVTNTDTHFFFNQVLSDIFFTQYTTLLVGLPPLTKQMKPDVGITRKDI